MNMNRHQVDGVCISHRPANRLIGESSYSCAEYDSTATPQIVLHQVRNVRDGALFIFNLAECPNLLSIGRERHHRPTCVLVDLAAHKLKRCSREPRDLMNSKESMLMMT